MKRVLVVGGGIAGLTIATELERHHLPFSWVEGSEAFGGSLLSVHNPLYGWPAMAGKRGAEAVAILRELPICRALETGVRVRSVSAVEGELVVEWERGGAHERTIWDSVVLCTGTARRAWDVPGAAALRGRGIAYSTHEVGEAYRGQPVAVVGGGDAAVEGALRMAAMGCRVWLLVRGAHLRAGARFVAQLASTPAIEVWFGTEVAEVRGLEALDEVVLTDGRRLAVRALFVRVGVAPVLPLISPAPLLDEGGYLSVDAAGQSSVPGLFGAGEVTSREVSQVAAIEAQSLRVARRLVSGAG